MINQLQSKFLLITKTKKKYGGKSQLYLFLLTIVPHQHYNEQELANHKIGVLNLLIPKEQLHHWNFSVHFYLAILRNDNALPQIFPFNKNKS